MLVVVRDITDRKRAEDELVRSEERLRIIYENAPDAYCLTDLKGEFIDGNAAAEKMIGYAKDELFGKRFLEVGLLQKRDIPRAAKLLGRNVVGQATGPDVFNLQRRDGDMISVEISTYPVKVESQTLVLGMARDITERIKAEAEIRESEERFRSIAETAADAIVFMDHSGFVRYWNKAARNIFGYTSDEVIGKKVDLIIQEEELDLQKTEASQEELSGNGRELGKTIELSGRRKNGEEFPIELSLASWKTREGEFTSAIIRDVTAARNAQKRAKLQDRLAAVGQLAAGIAHDFNNILGTIILYSELMLNSKEHDPKERERLDTIFNQAQRGANLTAQILDFGRRSVMERHILDLVPFFKDLENLLSRTLPENVKLSFTYNDEEHYYINADPTRMQQVVMNLALNARDAMPDGGDLIVDVSQFEVVSGSVPFRDMSAGTWVRIRVSDTGIGIPTDVMPHIFEPFFTTKPQGRGTGLGLAQVYGIVKQHEGYIDADSQVPLGTMFTIYLPAMTDVSESEDVTEYESLIGGTGETILVVEDDKATRKAICEILESMGYQLLNVGDGEKALEVLKDDDAGIKLIISDLVMPNMGGRDLYDAVEASYPQIKMILMTGYPLGSHTRELLDRRRVTWLQKPFTTESLSKAVLQMLEKVV
jgi:two-component system cell cycle sensor histidine kinase/response regulator CckA